MQVDLTFDQPKEFLDYEYIYQASIPKHRHWIEHYECCWFQSMKISIFLNDNLLDQMKFSTGDFYLYKMLDPQYLFPRHSYEHLFKLPKSITLKSRLYCQGTQHFSYLLHPKCPTQGWRIEVNIIEQTPEEMSMDIPIHDNILLLFYFFI